MTQNHPDDDPSPIIPTHRKKEEKGEKIKDKKGAGTVGQSKLIGPALKTRQTHTIKYGVSKIVPQIYWEGNESPAVLQGIAAMSRICIPIC